MDRPLSIAVETSCRRGQVCLGAGDKLLEEAVFQADRRHAVQVIARLDDLLKRRGLGPGDLEEAYLSLGPGSFTGLRVGATAVRTLAQAVPHLRCVAVPTLLAVARNALRLDFRHLGVLMDAKDETVYLGLFVRRDGQLVPLRPPEVVAIAALGDLLPRPVLLIGEALGFCQVSGDGIAVGDEALWLPRAGEVWQVGREMATAGRFTPPAELRPLYLRKPEAVRLWERRGKPVK